MNKDLIVLNSVYSPREDSFFLLDTISEYISLNIAKKFNFMEMGTGTGLIAINLIKRFPKSRGLAVDISATAIKCAHMNLERNNISKSQLDIRLSNLFDQIRKDEKFDLIFFNPPYVASFKEETSLFNDARNWAGGKFGREIIDEFVKLAPNNLKQEGKIILLVSSQNRGIKNDLKQKFTLRELSRLELPEEILFCYLLEK